MVMTVNNKVKIIDTLYELREVLKSGSSKVTFEKILYPFNNFEEYYLAQKEQAKQLLIKDENNAKAQLMQKSVQSNKQKKTDK